MHTNFSLKPRNVKSDKSRDSSFYFWLVEWHRYRSTGLWEAWLLTAAKGELITLILLCVFFLSVFQPFNSERVVTVLHRWAIMVFFSSRSLSLYMNYSFLFLFVNLDWPCSFSFFFSFPQVRVFAMWHMVHAVLVRLRTKGKKSWNVYSECKISYNLLIVLLQCTLLFCYPTKSTVYRY